MIESGASSQFIDLDFARSLNLNLNLKNKPEDLVLADGLMSKVGQITHTCTLNLTIDQHLETLTFQVTKLAGWNLIVGKLWLRRHNPRIDWCLNTITFGSGYCQAYCLPVREQCPSVQCPPAYCIAIISRATFKVAARQAGTEIFAATMKSIPDEPADNAVNFVPEEYYEYLDLFTKKEAENLPPH